MKSSRFSLVVMVGMALLVMSSVSLAGSGRVECVGAPRPDLELTVTPGGGQFKAGVLVPVTIEAMARVAVPKTAVVVKVIGAATIEGPASFAMGPLKANQKMSLSTVVRLTGGVARLVAAAKVAPGWGASREVSFNTPDAAKVMKAAQAGGNPATTCLEVPAASKKESGSAAAQAVTSSKLTIRHYHHSKDKSYTIPLVLARMSLRKGSTSGPEIKMVYCDSKGLADFGIVSLGTDASTAQYYVNVEADGPLVKVGDGFQCHSGPFSITSSQQDLGGWIVPDDFSPAYNIHTVINRGGLFIGANGDTMPKVTVNFPASSTFYSNNSVSISGPASWFQWEDYSFSPSVILHEYGHFVMDSLADLNPPSVSYGADGIHTMQSHETNETAWIEGWADAYQSFARSFWKDYKGVDSSIVLGPGWIENVSRFEWNDTGSYVDLESPAYSTGSGFDVEASIAGTLWDLYDSASDPMSVTGKADVVSADFSKVWTVFRKYDPNPSASIRDHCWDFGDFQAGWKAKNGETEAVRTVYAGNGVAVVAPGTVLTQPSSPTPANGAVGISLNPVLTFQGQTAAPGDSLSYDFGFGPNSNPTLVSAGSASPSYSPGQLEPNGKYWWFGRVRNSKGEIVTGPTWSFTTQAKPNQPPQVTGSPSPANNASNVAMNVSLGFAGSDPDGDPIVFDVGFGESATPPLVATGLGSGTYSPQPPLKKNTTYFWFVVIRDNHGGTTTGPIWRFTTEQPVIVNQSPAVPTSPMPVDFATGVAINPTFGWVQSDPDAGDKLTAVVHIGSTSTVPIESAVLSSPSFTPTVALQLDTDFSWWVEVSDDKGHKTQGPIWHFRTQKGEPPIEPGGEVSLSMDGESGIGSWSMSGLWHLDTVGANSYAQAHGGQRALWYGRGATGSYDTGGANEGTLTSPMFSLPAKAKLKFYSRRKTEQDPNYDRCTVELSLDNGKSWKPVTVAVLNSGVWELVTAELGAEASASARLRWRLTTGDALYNGTVGWFADDIQVVGGDPVVPPSGGGVLLSMDVEAGQGTWGGSGLWHVDTVGADPYARAHGGQRAFRYGKANTNGYDTGTANQGVLTSPVFSLIAGYALEFWSYRQTEDASSYDLCLVELSTDGGQTWQALRAIVPNTKRWEKVSVSLGRAASTTARIRWRFDTIDELFNAGMLGWLVDDVQVIAAGGPVVGAKMAATASNTPPIAKGGNNVEVVAKNGKPFPMITLSGSGSSDAETPSERLVFRWTAPAGVHLSSSAIARPMFIPPGPGRYVFRLQVSDDGRSSPDAAPETAKAKAALDRVVVGVRRK